MNYEKYYEFANVKNKEIKYVNRWDKSRKIKDKDEEVIASVRFKKNIRKELDKIMPYNGRYSRKAKNFNDAINDKLNNITNYSNIN